MTPPPAPPDPPFAAEPVPADVLAWAAQTLDPADVAEQVRQIDAGHGRPLAEVIAELRRLPPDRSSAPSDPADEPGGPHAQSH